MDFLNNLKIKEENLGVSAGLKQGYFSQSENTRWLESINPSNGESIAKVSICNQEHYQTIIESASQAFLRWRQVPAPKRAQLVARVGQLLKQHKSDLGSLIALEVGKTKQEGDGEVQEMIDMAEFAVGQARMLYGLSMHSERSQHRMYEQWHPLGVVGVISAFNFPVAVWSWNAFIAAICGDTVIWKPSSQTPLCAIAVQNICHQAMQELGYEGVFSLMVTNDHAVAQQLIDDSRVALISFTGSCQTGQAVYQQVAKRMGRVLLELGGNNAIIIDETADLDLALRATVFGAVGTTGQRCTTTRRLIVHQSIEKEVCQKLITAYQQIKIGSPLEPENLMGPLINHQAVKNYIQVIDELKSLSAPILFGGQVLEQPGYFVEPTLVKADSKWDVVKRETFAPILYILSYQDFKQAIAIQNNVSQGLSSALFTRSLQNSECFLSSQGSDCGIANINIGTSGAEIGGAFGGEKATGGGREAGSDAWKSYMRRQTNTINWGNELPLAQGIVFDVK